MMMMILKSIYIHTSSSSSEEINICIFKILFFENLSLSLSLPDVLRFRTNVIDDIIDVEIYIYSHK